MRKWIFPCNPEMYNVDGAFSKLDEIEWTQSRFKVEVGDYVYIYVGKPVQSIRYLCEVIEKDIPVENCTLNDGEFSLTGKPTVTDSPIYMRIKLLKEYDEGVIPIKKMGELGIKNGRIQSARTVPKDLEAFIDEIDASDKDEPLSDKAIEVASALLTLLANRRRLITYGELSDMTKSKPSPHYEMNGLLDSINRRCEHLGLPHISAMVVNKATGLPGEGFKDLCVEVFGYDPDSSTEEIFNKELKRIGKCADWHKLADSIEIEMPLGDEEPLPEELELSNNTPIYEGAKKTITVNSYERDHQATEQCKDYYMKRDGRIICQICGFDFGEVYGPEYSNKIHVHHIKPLSEIGETYVVDPIKDLIPVCPNCHMVLHTGKGISVKELKSKLKAKDKKGKL